MEKMSRILLLDLLDGCKQTYPNEFFAYLGKTKDVIDHFIAVPIFYQTEDSVAYYKHTKPVDFSIVGTIHSHPSGNSSPSSADKHSFFSEGNAHIIVSYPYTLDRVAVYDSAGKRIQLELV
ncbi:MAG: Mov34/MPN/PAD-1 family protein [Candidatus ainarchaeum sp.]|nr:Mov34/MPN/PAD-1 family protein [Candidatus ainarchaeum sp.]